LIRTPVTWLIYAQLGLWGYFNYGFGPIVPLLRDEQGTTVTQASLHSTAIAVGAVAGGALFPALSRRYGRGNVMWACLAGIAICVLGYVTIPSLFAVTIALTVLIAVCGIALVSGVTTVLSDEHAAASPAAISEANAVACAAGLVAPLVIWASVDAGWTWRPGLAALLIPAALVVAVAVRRRIALPSTRLPRNTPPPRGARPTPAAPPSRDSVRVAATSGLDGGNVHRVASQAGRSRRAALPGTYWLAWGMMTITGAIEVMLSMWAASVLRDQADLTPGTATAVISAIVAGMFLGRIIGARIALRIPAVTLYFGALVISAAGFAMFWTATGLGGAVSGLLLLGLGNAMHYPLAISLALAAAPGQADRAAGVASYSMGVSFGLGPLLLGLIADRLDPHTAFLLVPVLLAAAALLAWRLQRRLGRDRATAATAPAAVLTSSAPA
jgi:MFS family permease